MHKKDIVKQVIDKYIKQGKDFFELTPSYLTTIKELKGFSERTLKRGRTEYKNDHKSMIKGNSKAKVNLRKRVFEFLDSNPSSPLVDLKRKFKNADKALLKKNMALWKSENRLQTNRRSGSLRQNVFSILEKEPTATLNELEKRLPDVNRKTISNYLDQWRKRHQKSGKRRNTKQRVFTFLDLNPDATLKEVKQAFPDTNPSSLGAYVSLWKHRPEKERQPASGDSSIRGEQKKDDFQQITLTAESARQIISALNNTIEAQKKAIDILKQQNESLRKKQSYIFPELNGMSENEIEKFEKVMSTFLRGLKKT